MADAMTQDDAAYLEHCSQEFVHAIAEARELALAGDARVADTLLFASDLLDIIADGLKGAEPDAAAAEALADASQSAERATGRIRTARAALLTARVDYAD